jgi:hypothetical protein
MGASLPHLRDGRSSGRDEVVDKEKRCGIRDFVVDIR